MIGHRITAISLTCTGDFKEALPHYDQALALYDPSLHRTLGARFGHEPGVAVLSYRPFAAWVLGYPDAALRDSKEALRAAREIGQAATLMYALAHAAVPHLLCGDQIAAAGLTREVLALAEEKSAPIWKGLGMMNEGWLSGSAGDPARAVELITSGIAVFRSTSSTMWLPLRLSHLAMAHAEIKQQDDAQRRLDDAMSTVAATKETWCEAEVSRIAGEVARLSPEPDAVKAKAHFERALAVARAQHAKSWELRAAMSMARLWRDQGKRHEAREILAPVYGWFTEGFDTLDLKQAKALLAELG
jgi:predicted ATPase